MDQTGRLTVERPENRIEPCLFVIIWQYCRKGRMGCVHMHSLTIQTNIEFLAHQTPWTLDPGLWTRTRGPGLGTRPGDPRPGRSQIHSQLRTWGQGIANGFDFGAIGKILGTLKSVNLYVCCIILHLGGSRMLQITPTGFGNHLPTCY